MSATHLCSPGKHANRESSEMGGGRRGCLRWWDGLQPRGVFFTVSREGKAENICPGWTVPKMDLTMFSQSLLARSKVI